MGGPLRYLALGDSWCTGEGSAASAAWPNVLAGMLRDTGLELDGPQFVAGGPWGTRELLGNLALRFPDPPDDDEQQFDLITLQIGYYDLRNGMVIDDFIEHFVNLVKFCLLFGKDMGWRLVVVLMPDWSSAPGARAFGDRLELQAKIDEWNAVMATIAQMCGYPHLLDLGIAYVKSPYAGGAVGSDGLHPSEATHARWAELALHSAHTAVTVPKPPMPSEEDLAAMERELQGPSHN